MSIATLQGETRAQVKTPIRDFLLMLALAVVVFVGLRFTVQTFVVYGPSMEPNFYEHQRLIVNKIVYLLHSPQRGDVIVFEPPGSQRDSYIKRIIGLPGERVEIRDGQVIIHRPDGTTIWLEEPYIKRPARHSYTGDIIPDGEYFVLGDNRNNTNDSRNGWTVPRSNIIGKAWVSIWPPSTWGLAANYPFEGATASTAGN